MTSPRSRRLPRSSHTVRSASRSVASRWARIAQQRTRDCDSLSFAYAEAVAALAHDGVVAVGQAGDQIVDAGGARGRHDVLVARLGRREAQVLADRGVQQERLLRDEPDGGCERLEAQLAHVDAVDRHAALLHLALPRDQGLSASVDALI
jgi:hypothetical protein